MRNYRPLLGLFLVICLFFSPFVYSYLRYALGFSQDPTDGNFTGIVQLTFIGRDPVTGHEYIRDLGPVVVEYKQRPLVFSYLSRVKSSARIADAKGNERIFGIVRYDQWQIAWQGPSDELFVRGANQDILEGYWNKSVQPFALEFKERSGFPLHNSLKGGKFELAGTLQPASSTTFESLRKQLAQK